MSATIINNVLVLNMDVLEPEYHTYAVTFPSPNSSLVEQEMTLVINVRKQCIEAKHDEPKLVKEEDTDPDTTLVNHNTSLSSAANISNAPRHVIAHPASLLIKRTPLDLPGNSPNLPFHGMPPVLGYKVRIKSSEEKENKMMY